jgi:Spy/CpxP family protein refolding chaperone
MKSFKLLLSVLALVSFAAAPALRAVEATTTPPPAGGPEHKGPRGGNPEQRLAELTKKLELTDEQVAKIKPIIMDEVQEMKALKEDTSIDKEAKKPKMMEIRKSHMEQIAAILTPEQKAKFKAGREKRKEKGGEAPAPKPAPAQ